MYYRRDGRRYVKLTEPSSLLWKDGFYLVHVTDNATRITPFPLDPAFAHVEAAMHVAEEAMVSALKDEMTGRPQPLPLTKAQVAEWRRFERVMGGSLTLWHKSPHDIIQAGITALRNAILARRGVSRVT